MIALKVVQWRNLTNQQRATESRVEHKLERITKSTETMAQPNAELRQLENEEHLYLETVLEAHSSDELLSPVHPWSQVNPQFDLDFLFDHVDGKYT